MPMLLSTFCYVASLVFVIFLSFWCQYDTAYTYLPIRSRVRVGTLVLSLWRINVSADRGAIDLCNCCGLLILKAFQMDPKIFVVTLNDTISHKICASVVQAIAKLRIFFLLKRKVRSTGNDSFYATLPEIKYFVKFTGSVDFTSVYSRKQYKWMSGRVIYVYNCSPELSMT